MTAPRRRSNIIAPTLLVLGLALFWEAWVRLRDTPSWLLPPPSAILRGMADDRGLLLQHGWVTLQEVLVGFMVAAVVGVLAAVAMDRSPAVARALGPIVVASQTIPVVAIAPLLVVWFGYGMTSKVIVTALVSFFPIAVNTRDGLASADRDVLAMLHGFGANRWLQFRIGKVPAALPYFFSGARIAIAVAVIGAVFGELVGASQGLGYLITRSTAQFLTERVFGCLIVLSVMGISLYGLVALAERFALPWRRLSNGNAPGTRTLT